jgi:hypothetical protein
MITYLYVLDITIDLSFHFKIFLFIQYGTMAAAFSTAFINLVAGAKQINLFCTQNETI